MIAIEDAVIAVTDLVEQLAKTGGEFDEADLYRVLKNREAQQWHKGKPSEAGEYIVIIEGATQATCLEYVPKYNAWFDDNDNDYAVECWMELPEPPEVKE